MKTRHSPTAMPSGEFDGETKPISFSVITVCFNSVSTIEDTLKSVASQTWPSVEHIVIDGGSSDGTQEQIKKHADRLSQFISEPDAGIYDAMNKGVAIATGDVVCFLNSDDAYAREDVLGTVASLMGDKELDAVYGDVVYFRTRRPEKSIRRYNSATFRPGRLSFGLMPAHPALFLRREVFSRIGEFRRDYKIAGDFDFVARAFQQGLSNAYIPQVLVRMRIGGISTAGWKSRVLLNQEILRACRENGIKTNILKLSARYPLKILELYFK